MQFTHGAALSCQDSWDFGGLTGLTRVGENELLAVSDRGHWMTLPLDSQPGAPASQLTLHPLDHAGRPGRPQSLSVDPSSANLFVSLGGGGVLRYDGARPSGAFTTVPVGDDQCVSTIELLDDASAFVACDSQSAGATINLSTGRPLQQFRIPSKDGMQTTAAARLAHHPLGGVLVLQRRFVGSGTTGFGFAQGRQVHARVIHIPAAELTRSSRRPSEAVASTTVLELFPGVHTADSFEGLAVAEEDGASPRGARVFLLSNDNFNRDSQKVLLFEFWLPYPTPYQEQAL